jgi:periplasmic protein CpxP/Spy
MASIPLVMKYSALVLAILTSVAASPLVAQTTNDSPAPSAETHPHGRHHGGWLWKNLNLTDAQKQQIHQIKESNKQASRSAMLAVLTANKALQSAIGQNPSDEATIRSLSVKLESARTEATVQRTRVHALIVQVLTPAQQQQLAQFAQKRQDRLQQRIDKLSQENT